MRMLVFIAIIIMLCSCSQGNRDFSNRGKEIQLPTQPISFVAASTYYYNLPKTAGGVELELPVYVSNNSPVAISGISYTESSAVNYVNITSVDASNCANVTAGQTCKYYLKLSLESGIYNGSILLNANYTINSNQYQISTIMSFNATDGTSQLAPVYDKSVLTTTESPNTYLELFYLTHGESTANYKLKYLNGTYSVLDSNVKDGATVHGGDSIYMLLKANPQKVQNNRLKLTNLGQTPEVVSGQVAKLTDANGADFQISASVATPQIAAGVAYELPYILSGVPSVITTKNQKLIAINFLNVGNANAKLIKLNYNAELLSLLNNNCGNNIESSQSCTVLFSTLTPRGSENVTLNYTAKDLTTFTTVAAVNWYFDTSSPIIIPTIQNVIGILKNVVSFVDVMLTNLGAKLDNVNYSIAYGNADGSASLNGDNNCSSLLSNSSCRFEAMLFSSVINSAPLVINGTGTYGSSESYGFSISANVVVSSANKETGALSTESPSYSMSIIDNNYESTSSTIVYRNVGLVATNISDVSLAYLGTSTQESWIYIQKNNCNGKTLQSNQTCNVIVKLGPVIFPENNMEVKSTISLNARYTYDANGTVIKDLATTLIKYQIGATDYNVFISNVSAINSEGGIGLLSSPYVFAGFNDNLTNPQQVVVSYQNSGSDPVLVSNIQQSINTAYWNVSSDSCSGAILNPLSGGQYLNSCQITYTNVYYELSSMVPSINRNFSFNLPNLIVQDIKSSEVLSYTPTYFGQTEVSVFESMALLSNSVSLDNVGNLVLTQVLESYAGYPTLTLKTTGGYFIDQLVSNDLPDYVNCNYALSMGNLTQLCTVNASLASGLPLVITNIYSLYTPAPTDSCLSFYFSGSSTNAVIGSNAVMDNSLCF